MTKYEDDICNRTRLHYLKGLIARWLQHFKYDRAVRIARKRGATIGDGVIMPVALAKMLNSNVTIGDHTSIATTNFSSFRFPIKIGSHVIIGGDVRFNMGSHRLDTPDWENFRPNDGLVIEDYVWVCPYSIIQPSVKRIGRGAVVGSGANLVKDLEPMKIAGGNPAKVIKERACVHSDLVVESLLGGDYRIYKQTWKSRKSRG